MSKKKVISSGRLEEIVEEIVNNLPPRKGFSHAEITVAVRQAISELREKVPWQMKLSDRAAMKAHARKLYTAVSELELLLETAPGMMWALLFSEVGPLPNELMSKEKMVAGFISRSEPFFDDLNRLRKGCAQAIKKGWGTHPNYDHAKSLSAQSAYDLMKAHSAAKITGTEDGPFRTVTSLIYEAISGRGGVDLKRACQAVSDRMGVMNRRARTNR